MNHSKSMEQIKSILKEKGLRITYQRVLIYKELNDTVDHPTAEMIHEKLKLDHPMISLGTVYKTLDCFHKCGLIRKMKPVDDSVHYDADLDIHTHIIEKSTNKILDFYDEELNRLLTAYIQNNKLHKYKITDFELNLYGEVVN